MNQSLINCWNAKVSEKDEIYVLGDFMFGSGEAVKARDKAEKLYFGEYTPLREVN